MHLRRFITTKHVLIFAVPAVIIVALCAWWVWHLHVAHSSLVNYAAFRGCVSLSQVTDTDALCALASGEHIKLVQVGGKWFLDGDLGW